MSKSRKKSVTRKLSKDEPKSKCCKCLKWIPIDEYFDNDFYCNECAARKDFPLASPNHFKVWFHEDKEKITNESN